MSAVANVLALLHKPYMVYGCYDHTLKSYRKYTRISSTAKIINKKALSIGDYVWVWHYTILDATGGLIIEEGCQINAWVGIFTHGSENSIRLLGKDFVHIHHSERKGYTQGSVKIGAYTFVGAGSIIMPGVTIGKGCFVGPGTIVSRNVPDYTRIIGKAGKTIGTTIDVDKKFFEEYDFSDTYYDTDALKEIHN